MSRQSMLCSEKQDFEAEYYPTAGRVVFCFKPNGVCLVFRVKHDINLPKKSKLILQNRPINSIVYN